MSQNINHSAYPRSRTRSNGFFPALGRLLLATLFVLVVLSIGSAIIGPILGLAVSAVLLALALAPVILVLWLVWAVLKAIFA